MFDGDLGPYGRCLMETAASSDLSEFEGRRTRVLLVGMKFWENLTSHVLG